MKYFKIFILYYTIVYFEAVYFLQELFFKYTWSNFLHTQVEVCLATVLSNAPAEVDGNQEAPLLNQVSQVSNLYEALLLPHLYMYYGNVSVILKLFFSIVTI